MIATLQVFTNGRWRTVGTFTPRARTLAEGIAGDGLFEYDHDYVLGNLSGEAAPAISLRYPVNFELYSANKWPAFLLDIMPSGAGRRIWLRRLDIKEGPAADWEMLTKGAGNPPGNLRVAEAVIPSAGPHPGFTRGEIIEKNADFIEYAEARGAVMAGATDVQGDAPKFLLVRDRKRRWHPDGALDDAEVLDCWLVKFPRGNTKEQRIVLRNEAQYLEVARRFGLRVGASLEYIDNALFVPRFDRVRQERLERHGLESLFSAAGIAEFGRQGDHRRFCAVIARFATDAKTELIEYVRRDVLNAALRNTDNHGRNTAFLKTPDGTVALSPLYDFAAMFLDPDGIPRSSRWGSELEPTIGRPVWGRIAEHLSSFLDPLALRDQLAKDAGLVERLPETMRECGVEDMIIDRVAGRCAEIAADLFDAGQKRWL